MVLKSLEYPLLATTMTKTELGQIMSTILKIGLSRSGICRNISRDAVFSINKYFGFDINHLFVTRGIRKLKMFLSPQGTTTAHLITTSLHYYQKEVGLGEEAFTHECGKEAIRYVTSGWITSLGDFLHSYNIQLTKHHKNPFRFRDDNYLMALAITKGIKGQQLKLFNCCRIILKVELLSDIITADGQKVKPNI